MPLLQDLAYAGKSVPIGHAGIKAAKFLAGLAFDLFKGDYRVDGMVFHVPREHTPITVRGRFMAGTYEEAERQLAMRHLPPDATVLELGGCIGVLSCTINRRLAAPRRHIVLEAHPALRSVLERNRDANGCSFAVRHAVLSRRDDVRFCFANLTDGHVAASGGIPVPTVTLEELEQDTHLSFDALVMDIEGGEAAVIDENPAWFDRLKFLLVEFTPTAIGAHGVSRLREKLVAHGLNHIDTMMATEVWVR
jgi:FkbM family methyltransferase